MKVFCPIDDSVKILFETNASNTYFDRNIGNGEFEISNPQFLKSTNLWNGIFTLEIDPRLGYQQSFEIGDEIPFEVIIKEKELEKFKEKFTIEITEPKNKSNKKNKKRKRKREKAEPYGRKKIDNEDIDNDGKIALPQTKRVSKELDKEEWESHFTNIYQGAVFKRSGQKLIAFVNVSNPNLIDYVKRHKGKLDPEVIYNAYENLVGLIPFGIYLLDKSKLRTYEEKDLTVLDFMNHASDSIALMGIDVVFLIKASRI